MTAASVVANERLCPRARGKRVAFAPVSRATLKRIVARDAEARRDPHGPCRPTALYFSSFETTENAASWITFAAAAWNA
jgi:hypothetical protein